jgi:hypothetical protein
LQHRKSNGGLRKRNNDLIAIAARCETEPASRLMLSADRASRSYKTKIVVPLPVVSRDGKGPYPGTDTGRIGPLAGTGHHYRIVDYGSRFWTGNVLLLCYGPPLRHKIAPRPQLVLRAGAVSRSPCIIERKRQRTGPATTAASCDIQAKARLAVAIRPRVSRRTLKRDADLHPSGLGRTSFRF